MRIDAMLGKKDTPWIGLRLGAGLVLVALAAGTVAAWSTTQTSHGYEAYDVAGGATFLPLPPSGAATPFALEDDCLFSGVVPEVTNWISLPFSFKYFRESTSRLRIHNNMFLVVDTPGNAVFVCDWNNYNPSGLPSTSTPNTLMAPLWHDMIPTAGSYWTTGLAPNRIFVVEFEGYVPFDNYYYNPAYPDDCLLYGYSWTCPSPPVTLQVQIRESDSSIEYHYVATDTSKYQLPTRIGIEGCGGARGFTAPVAAVLTGNAYRFVPLPNVAPTANPDTSTTTEDATLSVAASAGVLVNDKDDFYCRTPLKAVLVTAPRYAQSFSLNSDGSYTYRPNLNFYGKDQFTYQALDEQGALSVATTVTITVNPKNDMGNFVMGPSKTGFGPFVTNIVDAWITGIGPGGDFALTGTDTCSPPAGTQSCQDGRTVSTTWGSVSESASLRFTTTVTSKTGNLAFAATGAPKVVPDVFTAGHATTGYQDNPASTRWGRLTFAAAAHTCGTATLSVTMTDNGGTASTADDLTTLAQTATIEVDCIEYPPVATDQALTMNEDGTLAVTLKATDFDDPQSALKFTLDGTAPAGLTGTPPALIYKPSANLCTPSTPVQVPFKVEDPGSNNDTGLVTVNVKCLNDAPVATADAVAVVAPRPAGMLIDVVANDFDVDAPYGDTISLWSVATPTSLGGKVVMESGKVRYTPPATLSTSPSEDVFTYRIRDKSGALATGTVTVHVALTNQPPVAHNATVALDEDTTAGFALQATDPEDSDDLLLFTWPSGTSAGATIIGTSPGALTIVPAADWCGQDTMDFQVQDTYGATDNATVTFDVHCINDPPRPQPDAFTFVEDSGTHPLDVRANDMDVDDAMQDLTIRAWTQVPQGTIWQADDGSLRITLHENATGGGQFTYTVEDAGGAAATAEAVIRVTSVPDLPVTRPDVFAVTEDAPMQWLDVLANDRDGDGRLVLRSVSPPAHGSIAISGDHITFTPGTDRDDDFVLHYTAADLDGNLVQGMVTIDMLGVNDPPVAMHDAPEGGYVVHPPEALVVRRDGSVLANDRDVDGDELEAVLVEAPAAGTLQLRPDGTFTYDAYPLREGTASFTYMARDPSGAMSDPATVFIVLVARDVASGPGADAPGLALPPPPMVAGPSTAVTGSLVSLAGVPAEGSQLVWSALRDSEVPFEVDAAGVLTFRAPDVGAGQTRTITFAARSDNGMLSVPVLHSVLVTPPNQPPTARIEHLDAVAAGTMVAVDGTGSSDPEGQPLTYTWRHVAGHEVALVDDHAAVARFPAPAAGYTVLGLVVDDGQAQSAQASVRVDFDPVAQPWPEGFTAQTQDRLVLLRVQSPQPGITYTWSLGDGTQATGAQVEHLYSAAGSYEVSLAMADGAGAVQTHGATVVVGQPASDGAHLAAQQPDSHRTPWLLLLAASAAAAGIALGVLWLRRR